MTLKEIHDLLKLIKGVYGNRFFLDENTTKAWQTYLSPFPKNIAKLAMDKWVNEASGNPPPTDLFINMADEIWQKEINKRAIEDYHNKPKCVCNSGWVSIIAKDGHSSVARCGCCKKIGQLEWGEKDRARKLPIPSLDPVTLEYMGM